MARKIKIRIKKRVKEPKSFFKRLFGLIKTAVALVIIIAVGVVIYTASRLALINRTALPDTDEEMMINTGVVEAHQDEHITNIAIFGTDADDGEGNMRTDTIIIASFDRDNGSVTFTSVLRDTYVHIPDNGFHKINSAYLMGGPTLAIQTLNRNFDLNIRDYVAFDFSSLIEIVDAVGGIELTLSESEVENFNNCLANINCTYDSAHPSDGMSAGRFLFDGKQALAYTRMRYAGNGDFDRSARQRIVLQGVITKVRRNFNIAMIFRLPGCLGENITTSMSSRQIISVGLKLLKAENNMTTHSLSDASYMRTAVIDGLDMLVPYTLYDMTQALHSCIYINKYTPSQQVRQLSDEMRQRLENYTVYRIGTDVTI